MARINLIEPSQAQGKAKRLLEAVNQQMGSIPNLFKGFANSPAVLESYLAQVKALSGGALSPGLREQIALTVAGENNCNYCASAHTYLGGKAGVPPDELARNLVGRSDEEKTEAALVFARAIVESRGHIQDADLKAVREAGYSEAEITEIIAHVALNIFTNYFNHIAETEVDFPFVSAESTASAA